MSTTEKLIQLITAIHNIIHLELYELIDYQLLHIVIMNQLQELDADKIVTIIRVTYAVRDRIKYWDFFLERAEEEFEFRKLDSKELLQGLI